jgi:hypothetical protein
MNLLDTTGLLEPQIPHAFNLLDSIYLNNWAADTSETGVGKTYVAAWLAKQIGAPLVVICPKAVMPTWKKVLKSFGVEATILVNIEKLVRGSTPHLTFRKPIEKLNPKTGKMEKQDKWRYQLVKLDLPTGCFVILDEAHKCKGVTSLSCGLMIALKKQGYKTLTLSATQALSVVDMRAFGFATNLHNLYKWKQWCLDNGAVEDERFGTPTFDTEDDEAVEKMKNCHISLFETQKIASRLTRDQMGSLFPDNQVIAEAYDLGENSPKIQAVYDEMEEEIAKLEEGTAEYSNHIFAEMMKARRKAEMLKVPLIEEMVCDLYDEGMSVVPFLNFTESIVALSDRLKKHVNPDKIGYIYGEQSYKARWKDVDDFNADTKRILVCNLKAGGVALSFHDLIGKHPRASLISPSFSAIDILQALGRIHRQGGLTKCLQRIIFASGCIEERACNRVQSRLVNLSCLVDGDLTAGFKLFN